MFYQPGLEMGMINAWHNLILHSASDSSTVPGISASFLSTDFYARFGIGPVPSTQIETSTISSIAATFFIILCFFFATLGAAVFVQTETASGTRLPSRPWSLERRGRELQD